MIIQKELSVEQRILLRFIYKSHLSWDDRSIGELRSSLGASFFVDLELDFDEVLGSHPLRCLGCHTLWGKSTYSYPTILTKCPNCTSRPLKVNDSYLAAGEAKLIYLDMAIYWRNQHTRDYILSRIGEMRHDTQGCIHYAIE